MMYFIHSLIDSISLFLIFLPMATKFLLGFCCCKRFELAELLIGWTDLFRHNCVYEGSNTWANEYALLFRVDLKANFTSLQLYICDILIARNTLNIQNWAFLGRIVFGRRFGIYVSVCWFYTNRMAFTTIIFCVYQ